MTQNPGQPNDSSAGAEAQTPSEFVMGDLYTRKEHFQKTLVALNSMKNGNHRVVIIGK